MPPERNKLQELVLQAVDDRDGAVVLERHVPARAVGQEGDPARPVTHLDAFEQLIGHRIDGEHSAVALARHIDDFAVGSHRDTLRLIADLHGRDHVAGFQIDDAQLRGVLVGDVEPGSVVADSDLLGIGAGMNDALDFVGVDIDLTDAIGAPVGRRQRLLVDTRAGCRRAAQGDVKELLVGTHLDAARTLPQKSRRDDGLRVGVDDGERAGFLVGHVDACRGRWSVPGRRDEKNCRKCQTGE